MQRRRSWLLVVVLVSVASACNTARSRVSRPQAIALEQRREGAEHALPLQAADRVLVRSAQLGVEAEDVATAASRATAFVTAAGGYIATSTQSKDNWHLELRVPSNQLDATTDSVARLGKVTRRTVSAIDVTERAVDLDARVAALRASRDRLQQLLSRAATVADIAAVERQLAQTQSELDSLEGQLRSLRGQVSLSALTIDFTKPVVLGPLGWVAKGLATVIGKLFIWR